MKIETIEIENWRSVNHLKADFSDFAVIIGQNSHGKSNIISAYISPQINRAVKNKCYFYNCYGKEEEFYRRLKLKLRIARSTLKIVLFCMYY